MIGLYTSVRTIKQFGSENEYEFLLLNLVHIFVEMLILFDDFISRVIATFCCQIFFRL